MVKCTGTKKFSHSAINMVEDGSSYWQNNIHYQPLKCTVKGCDCIKKEILSGFKRKDK